MSILDSTGLNTSNIYFRAVGAVANSLMGI